MLGNFSLIGVFGAEKRFPIGYVDDNRVRKV